MNDHDQPGLFDQLDDIPPPVDEVQRARNIAAAQAGRDTGIEQADAGTDEWWKSTARTAFHVAAADSYSTGRPFTTFEVGERFGIPMPDEGRAWGAIATWGKKLGYAQHVGYVASTNPKANRGPVGQWMGTAKALEDLTNPATGKAA